MSMILRVRFILVCFALVLSGCANGYKQFYQPAQGVTPEGIAARRLSPPPTDPIVERSAPSDPRLVTNSYRKRGYVVIGSSIFNAGQQQQDSWAVNQAREVSADLVLILSPRYTGSITSAVPITTPTSSTTYSTGTATAYGPAGTATVYGSGASTTYGTSTTYVPMTVHRMDYGAVYFVRLRFGLGAFFRDLNDSEKQALETNKGAVVDQIVDDSPAFKADLLVGDIVTALDGIPVSSQRDLSQLLTSRAGQLVSFSLRRKGKEIQKAIQLSQ